MKRLEQRAIAEIVWAAREKINPEAVLSGSTDLAFTFEWPLWYWPPGLPSLRGMISNGDVVSIRHYYAVLVETEVLIKRLSTL